MITKREETLLRAVVSELRAEYEPRIAALEARQHERGEKGEPGKDAAAVDVDALFYRLKSELPALIPAPIKGDAGERGEKGESGRDAASLEFVTLDEIRSYPRGTFALYKNGILFAERTTDVIWKNDFKSAGWRLLVSGYTAATSKMRPDGRTLEIELSRTDGSVEKLAQKLPLQKHIGVWREGICYEPCDQVQHAGSSWQAVEVTTDKPGTSKAWVLVARRGRDGKDA